MDTWIVLIEDRHANVDALPFSTKEGAVQAACAAAPDNAQDVQLTTGMRRDGWVLYIPYGPEGDCIRVVKRTMDEVPHA